MRYYFASIFSLALVFFALVIALLLINWDDAGISVLSHFIILAMAVVVIVIFDIIFPNWRRGRHWWFRVILAVILFFVLTLVDRILF